MIQGARKLPTIHVSIRVPWHDARWAGTVCKNPRGNTSCLALPRIASTRDDELESAPDVAGKPWHSDGDRLPACAAERGAFMAPFAYLRRVKHPYSKQGDKDDSLYGHFRETTFHHTQYSAAAVPFEWMMKDEDGIPRRAKEFELGFKPELEPDLSFDKLWVQERRNQLTMLDTFVGAIEPKESLAFFYAKRTPLTDDSRRVIIGIGRVLKVDPPIEYNYENGAAPPGAVRCVLWERNLHHSIRSDLREGFLLPYHDLLELAQKDSSIDLPGLVLHAPNEYRAAFSMGAEHVSHDQGITVLISSVSLLERIEKLVPGDWKAARNWIDTQLNRIWQLRGAFPGLGSALTAFGIPHGTLVAHAVGNLLYADGSKEIRNPWPLVDKLMHDPKLLPRDLASSIGKHTAKLWDSLKPERRSLLQLLARFEITANQATRWFVPEERKRARIELDDAKIVSNPYLCFEIDRGRVDPISVRTIDRGLFPDVAVSSAVPIPEPSVCNEAIDPRRGRAICIDSLDGAAADGHTLLPQTWLVKRVRDFEVLPKCTVGADWMEAFASNLEQRFTKTALQDGSPAWQLHEFVSTKELISTRVKRRLAGKRHSGDHDWRSLIDQHLPAFEDAQDPETEELARQEKARALEEIYRSRFSTLTGPAGTGKTRLPTALLSLPGVSDGGVLLLAPTGKARVQMQKRAKNAQAFTLAQFLLAFDRYDPETGAYLVSGSAERERGFKTVVIDESSMLTENQLAATFDAIETTAVERLILVGDPRQLPPIGAGRPFVDIVRFLKRSASTNDTPEGYAGLTIVRRQPETEAPKRNGNESEVAHEQFARDDIILARWFGGEAPDPGADEAWDRLAKGTAVGIQAVRWDDEADLQTKLLEHLKNSVHEIAESKDIGAGQGSDDLLFEVSLGGRPYKSAAYFHCSQNRNGKFVPGAGLSAETWQILSPIRSGETGVDGLNRWIQKLFRRQARAWAEPEKYWQRRTCKPLGPQGILYGDKVINVSNGRRSDVFPRKEGAYLANGEIGMVVGQYKGETWKLKGLPWKLEVEFSSQPGFKYGFGGRDFGEDSEARLELAYALTIHKAQGSEFGITFVVVPNPCRLLTRELLYTAITRQQKRIILFYQGELRTLLKFSTPKHSETARRLTNLFSDPNPVEYAGSFLEDGLIHRTARNELVRSKSEVIIANLLNSLGVTYAYEQALPDKDGSIRYPDFTIEDAESGQRVFIEHLGMMAEPAYRRRWEKKLKWYSAQDILPFGDGGGEGGALVTTTEERGIDSAAIERDLRKILNI